MWSCCLPGVTGCGGRCRANQDTNALCFMTAIASIGFSARENLEVNSICVPRMAGEAVGAIARLEHTDGSSITCNVEYNQLAPLLK